MLEEQIDLREWESSGSVLFIMPPPSTCGATICAFGTPFLEPPFFSEPGDCAVTPLAAEKQSTFCVGSLFAFLEFAELVVIPSDNDSFPEHTLSCLKPGNEEAKLLITGCTSSSELARQLVGRCPVRQSLLFKSSGCLYLGGFASADVFLVKQAFAFP
jgi:hypothetical protein